ncbi:MAG: hypothetical protein AAFV80_03925 [Bacteroidota bacterium]
MSELWNQFKNLFRKADESSPSNPLIHEVIQRSEEEKAVYTEWVESLEKRRMIDWINMEYFTYLSNPTEVDPNLDFLETPMSNGFVLHFRPELHQRLDFVHFLDYLKAQVLKIGYMSYVSDVRSYQKGKQVEEVQRHYLKPRKQFRPDQKMDQRYGNIMIELLSRNDQVVNLKFSATGYHDRKFETMLEFKELFREVLN